MKILFNRYNYKPNVCDEFGCTLLMYILRYQRYKLYKLLFQEDLKDFNLSLKDIQGNNILHYAIIYVSKSNRNIILDLIEKFHKFGLNIDERNTYGFTPLLLAVYCGRYDYAHMLLTKTDSSPFVSDYVVSKSIIDYIEFDINERRQQRTPSKLQCHNEPIPSRILIQLHQTLCSSSSSSRSQTARGKEIIGKNFFEVLFRQAVNDSTMSIRKSMIKINNKQNDDSQDSLDSLISYLNKRYPNKIHLKPFNIQYVSNTKYSMLKTQIKDQLSSYNHQRPTSTSSVHNIFSLYDPDLRHSPPPPPPPIIVPKPTTTLKRTVTKLTMIAALTRQPKKESEAAASSNLPAPNMQTTLSSDEALTNEAELASRLNLIFQMVESSHDLEHLFDNAAYHVIINRLHDHLLDTGHYDKTGQEKPCFRNRCTCPEGFMPQYFYELPQTHHQHLINLRNQGYMPSINNMHNFGLMMSSLPIVENKQNNDDYHSDNSETKYFDEFGHRLKKRSAASNYLFLKNLSNFFTKPESPFDETPEELNINKAIEKVRTFIDYVPLVDHAVKIEETIRQAEKYFGQNETNRKQQLMQTKNIWRLKNFGRAPRLIINDKDYRCVPIAMLAILNPYNITEQHTLPQVSTISPSLPWQIPPTLPVLLLNITNMLNQPVSNNPIRPPSDFSGARRRRQKRDTKTAISSNATDIVDVPLLSSSNAKNNQASNISSRNTSSPFYYQTDTDHYYRQQQQEPFDRYRLKQFYGSSSRYKNRDPRFKSRNTHIPWHERDKQEYELQYYDNDMDEENEDADIHGNIGLARHYSDVDDELIESPKVTTINTRKIDQVAEKLTNDVIIKLESQMLKDFKTELKKLASLLNLRTLQGRVISHDLTAFTSDIMYHHNDSWTNMSKQQLSKIIAQKLYKTLASNSKYRFHHPSSVETLSQLYYPNGDLRMYEHIPTERQNIIRRENRSHFHWITEFNKGLETATT
ncbi:unnamed protein product [Didymodactylos carnosus]|uniref:Uncharacterized protein n=1 Tax=Didymodactylos carnosus TaxID=1234261 RepID=A0A8S2EC66_9BILA|nr:unnamed protein product [Didymodactylos carnosus]CAF3997973.1 unnamed protein product [Didymodactylos carnosus]